MKREEERRRRSEIRRLAKDRCWKDILTALVAEGKGEIEDTEMYRQIRNAYLDYEHTINGMGITAEQRASLPGVTHTAHTRMQRDKGDETSLRRQDAG